MPSNKQMAEMCRALATLIESGVQMDRALPVAADQSRSPTIRRALRDAAARIHRGGTLAGALDVQRCFPPIFVRLVSVGEKSGGLDRVFAELARLFEFQDRLWKRFLVKIFLPAIQYVIAVFIISVVPYVRSFFTDEGDGLGAFLGRLALGYGIPAGLVLLYVVVVRRLGGVRACHEAVLRVPVIGGVARAVALARFSLVLRMMLGAGVHMKEAVEESFHATGNGAFAARAPAASQAVVAGRTLREALEATGLFPRDYLETIRVCEEAGRMEEQLDRLAASYTEKSELAVSALVTLLSVLIWIAVACVIVTFIFIMMLQYVAMLNAQMA